eukprot:PhM_4_TR2314/c0_g3_i1/m.45931
MVARAMKQLIRYEWRRTSAENITSVVNRFLRAVVGAEELYEVLVLPWVFDYFAVGPAEATAMAHLDVNIGMLLRTLCSGLQCSLAQGNISSVSPKPGMCSMETTGSKRSATPSPIGTAPATPAVTSTQSSTASPRMYDSELRLTPRACWTLLHLAMTARSAKDIVRCRAELDCLRNVLKGTGFAHSYVSMQAAFLANQQAVPGSEAETWGVLDSRVSDVVAGLRSYDALTCLANRMHTLAVASELVSNKLLRVPDVQTAVMAIRKQVDTSVRDQLLSSDAGLDMTRHAMIILFRGWMDVASYEEAVVCARELRDLVSVHYGKTSDYSLEAQKNVIAAAEGLGQCDVISAEHHTLVSWSSSRFGGDEATSRAKVGYVWALIRQARDIINSSKKFKSTTVSSLPPDARDKLLDAESVINELELLPDVASNRIFFVEALLLQGSVFEAREDPDAACELFERAVVLAQQHNDAALTLRCRQMLEEAHRVRTLWAVIVLKAFWRRCARRMQAERLGAPHKCTIEECALRELLGVEEARSRKTLHMHGLYLKELIETLRVIPLCEQHLRIDAALMPDDLPLVRGPLLDNSSIRSIHMNASRLSHGSLEAFLDTVLEQHHTIVDIVWETGASQTSDDMEYQRLSTIQQRRRARDEKVRQLAAQWVSHAPTEIHLGRMELVDAHIAHLTTALLHSSELSTRLTTVDVSHNPRLSGACVAHLKTLIWNARCLVDVDLSGNDGISLSDQNDVMARVHFNMAVLALEKNSVMTTSVRGLGLGENESFRLIDACERCDTLSELDVSQNNVTEVAGKALLAMYQRHPTLRFVDVSDNLELTPYIVEAIQNLNQRRAQSFDMRMEKEGIIERVRKALIRDELERIDLHGLDLTDSDLKNLTPCLQEATRWHSLALAANRLTDKSLPLLLKLCSERAVRFVDLQDNPLND